jgi:hypothetical protein
MNEDLLRALGLSQMIQQQRFAMPPALTPPTPMLYPWNTQAPMVPGTEIPNARTEVQPRPRTQR